MTAERVFTLSDGSQVAIALNADPFSLSRADREVVFGIVDQLADYEATTPAVPQLATPTTPAVTDAPKALPAPKATTKPASAHKSASTTAIEPGSNRNCQCNHKHGLRGRIPEVCPTECGCKHFRRLGTLEAGDPKLTSAKTNPFLQPSPPRPAPSQDTAPRVVTMSAEPRYCRVTGCHELVTGARCSDGHKQ